MSDRFPDGAFGYGKQWLSKQLRPKRQVTYIYPWFSHRVSLIYPRCRHLLRPNRQFPNIYKIWIKNQIYTQDNDKVSLGSTPCQRSALWGRANTNSPNIGAQKKPARHVADGPVSSLSKELERYYYGEGDPHSRD